MDGFFSVEEIEIASKENYWLMVENQFHVDHILSSKPSQPVKVWFGIDTGMHRLGFQGREVGINFQNFGNLCQPLSLEIRVYAFQYLCQTRLSLVEMVLKIKYGRHEIDFPPLTSSSLLRQFQFLRLKKIHPSAKPDFWFQPLLSEVLPQYMQHQMHQYTLRVFERLLLIHDHKH